MKTGCKELDEAIERIFSEIFTEEMTIADKVAACFGYLVEFADYAPGTPSLPPNTESYISDYDLSVVMSAYQLVTTGIGVCDDYAALFMVMTRALGLESYSVGGVPYTLGTKNTNHAWTQIKLGEEYYNFDPTLADLDARDFFFISEDNNLFSAHSREYTAEEFGDFKTYPFLSCDISVTGETTKTANWGKEERKAYIPLSSDFRPEKGQVQITVRPEGGTGVYRLIITEDYIYEDTVIDEIITGEKTYALNVGKAEDIFIFIEVPERADTAGYEARFSFTTAK